MNEITLDLTVVPFDEIEEEELPDIPQIPIKIYFAKGKKAQKAAFNIPVILESTEPIETSICGENLLSIESFYTYISKVRENNNKFYLVFGKGGPDTHIGSGFISSNIHFASFLKMGIREFLIVTINRDIFSRMIKGKVMLPSPLAEIMASSLESTPTVMDLIEQTRFEHSQRFAQISNDSIELETETVSEVPQRIPDEISKITIWKKYELLLYTLNNIFFSIDNHFYDLGRTLQVNPDIIKEICSEIIEIYRSDPGNEDI